jgi:hypothetical protein
MDCVESVPTVTLPKLTDGGITVRSEDFEMPVAVRLTITGESGALLLTIIFPVAAPLAAAVKVAETLALWPPARLMGSVTDVIVNSDPATETPETDKDLVPVFVIVKVFEEL